MNGLSQPAETLMDITVVLTLKDGSKVLARRVKLRVGESIHHVTRRESRAVDPANVLSYERTTFTRWLDEQRERPCSLPLHDYRIR